MILWGLSSAADDWRSWRSLAALSCVREREVAKMHWNAAGAMFVRRVLWPLRWFGLIDYRGP